MTDKNTTYLGLNLSSPIIAGASGLTANMKSIEKLQEAGAGALVVKSLFEEEVQLDRFKFEEELHRGDNRNAEMITTQPELEHAGPREHLMWVKETAKNSSVPVIGSLNAVNPGTWLDYARRMEDTGIDALECNLFASPRNAGKEAMHIEQEQIQLVSEMKETLSIPFSMKMSPFYTNIANMARRMDRAGADGLVMFNRLFEPEMDVDNEKITSPFNFSSPEDHRLPLRYSGLLYGSLDADICSSTGIYSGKQVAAMILAGAAAVQTVSSLYANGPEHLGTMLQELEKWMQSKNYDKLDDFRGKLCRGNMSDPWSYTRTQYVRLLMRPEEVVNAAAEV
jgi:dihydroorotate dehydrogenase (fumarate)